MRSIARFFSHLYGASSASVRVAVRIAVHRVSITRPPDRDECVQETETSGAILQIAELIG
jgi:hypothetical protein